MRENKNRFIYLISPNRIKKNFYKDLKNVLSTNKVEYFQLRLKKTSIKNLIYIGRKVKKICKVYNVKFIINDSTDLVKILRCDGCHLGQNDLRIQDARKIIKKKIIGVTCHNSKKLVKKSIKYGADYIALGAFYPSKTKKTKYRARINIISKVKKMSKIPIVAIGGINSQNYKKLLLHKVNFLAISSYIWNNKDLTPLEAVKILKK